MKLGKRVNVVTNKDTYRLYKWIEENKTELERLNLDQVTLKASKELDLVLTGNNISTGLEIVGVTIRSKRNSVKGVYTNSHVGKHVLLAKALVDLYILTGNEPPEYLGSIASNATMIEIIKTYNEGNLQSKLF
jgi:hypothetical protein